MAAVGVDVGYLATHLGVPETNISSVVSDPTNDLVNAVLAAVVAKAHEFDTLFSQKLQLEVELETSVRGAEAQRDASNETAKKALKDVEELRQKLNQEDTATGPRERTTVAQVLQLDVAIRHRYLTLANYIPRDFKSRIPGNHRY
ncbi:hypothetical protein F5Y12DRAFT_166342 [Xylaria sp. FL1777]|nr:hypothetical protein F5Y12DRAFT_166342 [Xylaria sp. FL1777]